MMCPLLLLALAFLPMAAEARLSARHEAALRRAGAVEPPGDVYRAMQFAYPACFAAMAAEAWWRGAQPGAWCAAGAVIFAAAKALKYWAIGTLGVRWSFRVLVPPGSSRIQAGPYRLLRHPNYAAVVLEFAGIGLMAGAPMALAASLAGFGVLLRRRIAVEEGALGMIRRPGPVRGLEP